MRGPFERCNITRNRAPRGSKVEIQKRRDGELAARARAQRNIQDMERGAQQVMRACCTAPTAPLQRVEYSAAAGSYTAPPVARARAPTDCGVWPGRPGTQSLEAHAGTQRPHRSRYRQRLGHATVRNFSQARAESHALPVLPPSPFLCSSGARARARRVPPQHRQRDSP